MDVEARSDNLLPVGKAVGVGAASAFACIVLIILLGIWTERERRRREGYVPMSTGLDRIPPEHLLMSLGASNPGKPDGGSLDDAGNGSVLNNPGGEPVKADRMWKLYIPIKTVSLDFGWLSLLTTGKRRATQQIIAPTRPLNGRVASSPGGSSMRSFSSYFTDSSSWDSNRRRRSGRILSNASARSSRSSWWELMSRSSNSDDPDWRDDELGAAARLSAIYGFELQPQPRVEIASTPRLDRIDEERPAEWI
jgi:hypothetical protein